MAWDGHQWDMALSVRSEETYEDCEDRVVQDWDTDIILDTPLVCPVNMVGPLLEDSRLKLEWFADLEGATGQDEVVSEWVLQRTKQFSKFLGVYCEGFEGDAMCLFSAIERRWRKQGISPSIRKEVKLVDTAHRELRKLQ